MAIQDQVKQLEAAAKAAVLADVNKQESWVKANLKPVVVGASVAAVIAELLAHIGLHL